jgi:hypothetical protein
MASITSITLFGPVGQGPVFLEAFAAYVRLNNPGQLKSWLKSLAAQNVLKLVYVTSSRQLALFYGNDQVALNVCPYWNHTSLPPPTITIQGVVVTTHDTFGLSSAAAVAADGRRKTRRGGRRRGGGGGGGGGGDNSMRV